MEILFEILGDLLEGIVGWLINSPRVPRAVRVIIILVICLPIVVLCGIGAVSNLFQGRFGAAAAFGVVSLGMSLIGLLLLRRVFAR